MPKYVTLEDIARSAKLHKSAVSLALRNNPRIPSATRLRVQKIAQKLGYFPDPMLSSLAKHRWSSRPLIYRSTLAWVISGPSPDWWTGVKIFLKFHEGAQKRARELGYKLELFWLGETGMNVRRATSVLRARNISGLVLAPQYRSYAHLNLDWSNFSAVSIGYTLTFPKLHTVAPNQFRAAKTVVRKLKAYGYRRIGLALMGRLDKRVDHGWSGGFLGEQVRYYPDVLTFIPPFLPKELPQLKIESAFWQWYGKYRPQVIITTSTQMGDILKKRGVRVPGDVGLAFLNLEEDSQTGAGICMLPLEVGAAAIDMLTGMMQRNEKGIPKSPQRLVVEGIWRDGSTLRKLADPKAAALK